MSTERAMFKLSELLASADRETRELLARQDVELAGARARGNCTELVVMLERHSREHETLMERQRAKGRMKP